MRHFRPKIVMDSLLRMSPHACQQRLSKICFNLNKITPKQYQMLDQKKMREFEYQTFCQYLIDPHYRIFGRLLSNPTINFRQQYHLRTQKIKEQTYTQPLKTKITPVVRNLNDRKNQYTSYQEAQQIILSIKPQQAPKYKKNLTYIYKWIVSQKEWSNPDFQKSALYIKKLIIRKIQEGSTLGQMEKVKKQLQSLQRMQKKKKKSNKKITPPYQQKSLEIDDKKQ